jgi:DNA-binding CsgD family transcriptional regulator
MAPDREWSGPELVGRSLELDHMGDTLHSAVAHIADTLVVSGDPGIGKTALVRQACARADPATLILVGECLPLASVNLPLLPLHTAFRNSRLPEGIPRPVFGTGGQATSDSIVAIDNWLSETSRGRPVVLVIDDLHWADEATLQTLRYLIAGPRDRPLSILATVRTAETGDGHPLQRWLADVRSMPRVSWLRLGPLDYAATGAQLAQVLGAEPHRSLIGEVYSHSAGNPYLNRLLVSGLPADARHLPPHLPADLKAAVLRSWHTLSPEARKLTEVMAVGGHPMRAEDLDDLLQRSSARRNATALLGEAAAAGITDRDPGGTRWRFHHPLIVEVLEQRLEEGDRRRLHAAFAALEATRLDDGSPTDFETLAALAHHHDAAGNTADAYTWTVRAAAAANETGGKGDEVRLLRRALELQGMLGHDPQGREALLNSLRTAAANTGAMEDELEVIETLIAETAAQRPLDLAELLVRDAELRFTTGREFLAVSRMQRAVELAGMDEDSWQYALALAGLAAAELWNNDPRGAAHAAEALAGARRPGNSRALSSALSANAMAAIATGDLARCRELSGLAAEAAAPTRDFWALFSAIMWQASATETWDSQPYIDCLEAGRRTLAGLGAPHVYIATISGYMASSFMAIGRWKECGTALRMALGSDPGIMGDAGVRLTAARLALWQGRQHEAEAHLARAEEISAHKSEFMNLPFDPVRAEVLLAAGNPGAAYATAMRNANPERMGRNMNEWKLPLAARALADLIRRAKDEDRPTDELSALADDLLRRFPGLPHEAFESELYTHQLEAFTLLYRAEIGRARSGPGNPEEWVLAADAFRDTSLRWEEAYACCRAVEALLVPAHTHRARATEILRRGLEVSRQLQAFPLITALTEIAAQARIATPSSGPGSPADGPVQWPGLTVRERELLGLVVCGATNAQIARALGISLKTVSTHVSNILRKTGTANRRELSRLVTGQGNARAPRSGRP